MDHRGSLTCWRIEKTGKLRVGQREDNVVCRSRKYIVWNKKLCVFLYVKLNHVEYKLRETGKLHVGQHEYNVVWRGRT